MRCLVLSLWHVAMYLTSGNILLELIHSTVCHYLLKCLVLSLWHMAVYITSGNMYVTCICYIHNITSSMSNRAQHPLAHNMHNMQSALFIRCLLLSWIHLAMNTTWGNMYVTCVCYIHNMQSVAACCSMFHVYVTHVWYIHIAFLKILQHAATLMAICMLYTYEWQYVCYIHMSVAVCCSMFKEAMCI